MSVRILSIDPGKEKCGLALLDLSGQVLKQKILPLKTLEKTMQEFVKQYPQLTLVIGNSTGREKVIYIAHQMRIQYKVVDEQGSSYEARKLYFQANPPRGLKRILPQGLRIPSEAIDDWSAVVIGRRFLSEYNLDGDSDESIT